MKSLFGNLVLAYLRWLTTLQLMKVHPTIVGVTGSAGKSSTIQAISAILQDNYNVKIGLKGNSQSGIPFEILNIPVRDYQGAQWLAVCLQALRTVLFNWEKYDVLVLEMGIDSDKTPNNMGYLLSIVHPQIGVLLNVNSVHSSNYQPSDDPLLSIANEKGKLLTSLPQDGLAILSIDQPQTAQLLPQISATIQTFSTQPKTDAKVVLTKYDVTLKGTHYAFNFDSQMYELTLPNQLQFKEAFGGFAAAIMIAQHVGLSVEQACRSLQSHFSPPPGRMTLIEGIESTTIIDSSYNSSPGATFPTLEMLHKLPGQKGVVLGDMRELGDQTEIAHQQLAEYAAKVADWIVLVGPLTQKYSLPVLQKLKFSNKKMSSVATAYQAIPKVKDLLQTKDLILVKGSQNTILLEIVVEALMKHPEHAKQLLCRQTPYWDAQRKKLKVVN